MIINITTLDDKALDVYMRLTEAQLRNKLEADKGIFIAESTRAIEVALDMGIEPLSMLMESRHAFGSAKHIIERVGDIPVYVGTTELISKITGYNLSRGILCAMKRPKPMSVGEILKNARRIAVFEDIVDTTNVGALMRSAAALNMDAVLLSPSCADPLCRRCVRVSMGTVLQVPWAYAEESKEAWEKEGIRNIQKLGFKVAALALTDDSISIDDTALENEEKLALVLGTEGWGLSENTVDACDYTVKIPMSHGVDSLNVAAAGAIAFWQFGKR